MASPWDNRYADIRNRIIYYADRYGIDRNIAIWQIWQESGFRATVCSHASACGIAQFIPDTARRYGVDRNNIDSSLDGWGRYMRDLLNMFGGRVDIALAGYNSGENRTEYRNAAREGRPINWSIMPAGVRGETQNYVNSIMRNAGASDAIPSYTGDYLPSGGGSDLPPVSGDNTLYYALGLILLILITE